MSFFGNIYRVFVSEQICEEPDLDKPAALFFKLADARDYAFYLSEKGFNIKIDHVTEFDYDPYDPFDKKYEINNNNFLRGE